MEKWNSHLIAQYMQNQLSQIFSIIQLQVDNHTAYYYITGTQFHVQLQACLRIAYRILLSLNCRQRAVLFAVYIIPTMVALW